MLGRIFTFFSVSVALLSIGIAIGFLAQQRTVAPPFPPKPCQGDSALGLSTTEENSLVSVDPCRVFSETYWEARQKFRRAAEQVQAELHALPVRVVGDVEYTVDVAVLRGPKGKDGGLLVHTSGVHGVEGYAGSAIQIAFLESVYPLWKEKKEETQRPTFIFIHAVNPYGMANYRRTNEHNVDLNRNGLHPDEWKKVVKRPTGIYAPYEQFSDLLNPQQAPTWLDAFVGLWAKASIPLFKHGFYTLKAAMVTGQYYNPKGIFYGGEQLEPSLSMLWDFFQQRIVNEKNFAGPVTWIDVHTGLGKSGQDTLLVNPEAAAPDNNLPSHMETFFPGAHIPQVSPEAKAVFKGYDNTKGITLSFFLRLFQQSQQQQSKFLGIVQEFGTVSAVLVAHALILENQAFHNLLPAEALQWANVTTRRAFYKQTPKWRRSVLERGLRLLFQATKRSSMP